MATRLRAQAYPGERPGAVPNPAAIAPQFPNVANGNYYLLVVVDKDGLVSESNEANNVSAAVAISVVRADLVAEAVAAPSTVAPGQVVNVSWTGRNAGPGTANGAFDSYIWDPHYYWWDRVYVSTDAAWSADDVLVGSYQKRDALAGGATYAAAMAPQFPAVANGNYYLLVVEDKDGLVDEGNEANNVSAALAITVGRSDLVAEAFTAPDTIAPCAGRTVPVNVDAVLFWMVYDVEKAALEVQDYAQAVSWASQTALRDIIGRTTLTELLRGRERIEDELQRLIDERTTPWGVTVQSVEMRDVVIPDALQDAMSREAQASREKQARVILGQAEVEIAQLFNKAAESYHDNPTALHLRAMNMLYEGLKEKGAMMIVPSTAVESMGMGGLLGAAAMRQKQLAEGSEEIKLQPVE